MRGRESEREGRDPSSLVCFGLHKLTDEVLTGIFIPQVDVGNTRFNFKHSTMDERQISVTMIDRKSNAQTKMYSKMRSVGRLIFEKFQIKNFEKLFLIRIDFDTLPNDYG